MLFSSTVLLLSSQASLLLWSFLTFEGFFLLPPSVQSLSSGSVDGLETVEKVIVSFPFSASSPILAQTPALLQEL